MATREQEYEQLKGLISISIGKRHIESLKTDIQNLQNKQKELNQNIKDASQKKAEPQEISTFIQKAPLIFAIAGAFLGFQFFGFNIITAFIAAVIAAVLGLIIGIVYKKSKQSEYKNSYQRALAKNKQDIKNNESDLLEIKNELSSLQKELKSTQEDVSILNNTYLSDPTLKTFIQKYGMNSVEMLILYFDRGRADTIQDAIDLYVDEARDKARIERAMEEIDRSTFAYVNTYIDTLKRLGRKNEYNHLENSAETYNKKLAKENKEMREIMDNPER